MRKFMSMLLAILLLLSVMPVTALASSSPSDWAKDGVSEAISKGFVPIDLQNDYQNVITRLEFCRMAIMWLEYVTDKSVDELLSERELSRYSNPFVDTNHPDVLVAYALGITSGTSPNTFTPNGQFSREQAATMIRNVCKVIGVNTENPPDSNFADLSIFSDWAIESINFCKAHNIMSGTGDNIFSPKATYTREQSILTFNNIDLSLLPITTDNVPPVPTPSLQMQDTSGFEMEVLYLVNIERENNGLSPLEWDEDLAEVARAHSVDMAERGYFDHINPDGLSPFDRMKNAGISYYAAAENIAKGYRTPEAVVEGWMNSPGHRANILRDSITHIGVGFHEYHWTQVFKG